MSTRMMPCARKNAFALSSVPTIAPVCDAAARRPASERPAVRDDGLPAACAARGPRELIGITKRFEEEQYHFRLGIVDQQVCNLSDSEIAFITDRYELEKPRPRACPRVISVPSAARFAR
jgi:hypothetical protein